MGRLGQFFPPDRREDFVTRCLKPGHVVYLDCHFIDPPQPKYFVLAAFARSRPLLFKINTHIRPYIQCRPALLACQVGLSVAQHDFMDHDRFVDCSIVIEEFSYQELKRQLTDDLSRIKGKVDGQVRAHMVGVVRTTKTISAEDKRLIIKALQD